MKTFYSPYQAIRSLLSSFQLRLLMIFLIGNCLNTHAQEGYHVFTCGTPNPSTTENSRRIVPNQSGSLRSACTDPDSTKYVNVNVHFILRADGTGNYDESSDGLGGPVSGYQAAYELISTANELFANNPQVYQPIANSTPALPTRIQYLLRGVYFLRNNTAYNYDADSVGRLDNYSVNLGSEINIFIAGDNIVYSGIANSIGVFTSAIDPIMMIGDQMWSSFNHGYTKALFYRATPISLKLFYYAQNINHEIGHLANLYHPHTGAPCPVVGDPDLCTDTHSFCPNADYDPIAPQTNPYNGQSCPGPSDCTNTFMDNSLNHFAVTPCQIDRMHDELESTVGMDYYDCDCLEPVPSFSIAEGDYTIYQNTIYLDCEHPGTYVPVFINAASTQYENCYEVTVEDLITNVSYTKIYYGPASSLNLQYVFPNMEVDHVYSVRLKAINTCAEDSIEVIISIEYDFGCGEWFLKASPNPANETLTIEYNIAVEKETDTEISIIEFNNPANLKTLKSRGKQNKGKHSLQINTNALKSGTYLIVLKTPGKTLNHKVQIIH